MPSLQSNLNLLDGDQQREFRSAAPRVAIKATAAETGGGFTLIEIRYPAAYATPLHIHYAEDIALYVLKGKVIMFLGEESRELTTGSYIFTPRGTPHGLRVAGEAEARILCISVPGGLDLFLAEQGPWNGMADSETVAARYKIEILGPLPE